ncbi:MAG: neutral/alkaline non-lysosomal ceramidase N-terminal domain-containing protein [Candidatus Latescibacteria bacterium]|jgi:hypothetical protein|nr:neutral/alkaline non-lysosomal ceramidase N-terminal domain-containing protein [Candidatus Latescibacterota bacterium]
MPDLEVGFAKTDITPREAPLTIYHRVGQPRKPTDVRDSLYARATAFRSGEQVAVLISLDLIGITQRLRDRVVTRLAEHGIPPAHVALYASHTHTAPTVVSFHGVPPTPGAYLSVLESAIVRTALDAVRSARPAELSLGRSTADLNVNRRQIGRISQINDLDAPTGLVDPDVDVAIYRFADGGETGCLFGYAAHPLTIGDNQPAISADYPGRAVAHLESHGAMASAQFMQGCSGNLNVKIRGDSPEAAKVGRLLGEAALEAVGNARVSASTDIRASVQTVRIPLGRIPTMEEARRQLEQELAKPRPEPRWVRWAQAVCRALEGGNLEPFAETLVQAMRVGDAVFLALPGEVFTEIGLAIKHRSACEGLLVSAYANDTQIGYLPTAAAFPEGGYEVDIAPRCYGLYPLSPECETILVEAGLSAVNAVS